MVMAGGGGASAVLSVRTNLMVRDMDVPAPNVHDGRRLEVVVDGLPLRGGAQLAIDTTMVCALHRDGTLPSGTQLARARA